MTSAAVMEGPVSTTYSGSAYVAAGDERPPAEVHGDDLDALPAKVDGPHRFTAGAWGPPAPPGSVNVRALEDVLVSSAAALTRTELPDFVADQHVNASRELDSIHVEIAQEARQHLGDPSVAFIFERLVPLCINQANLAGVPIERLELTTKRSREEHWLELVLRVFVPLTAAQGLGLWDALGDTLERWSLKLPPRESAILAERFAVFVEPTGSREL